MAWDEVWRGGSEAEAEIVAGSVRSSGYDARVMGSYAVEAAIPSFGMSTNAWAVLVPTRQAAAARTLLAREHDPGVAEPEARIDWRTHLFGLAAALIILAGILGLAVLSLVLGR